MECTTPRGGQEDEKSNNNKKRELCAVKSGGGLRRERLGWVWVSSIQSTSEAQGEGRRSRRITITREEDCCWD